MKITILCLCVFLSSVCKGKYNDVLTMCKLCNDAVELVDVTLRVRGNTKAAVEYYCEEKIDKRAKEDCKKFMKKYLKRIVKSLEILHNSLLSKIGQTYYVNDPRHPHQHPRAADEESGEIDENQASPRLRAGRNGEPYCSRCGVLIFFVAVVLIAAYLFRITRLHEFRFEFFDAMALAVVIVAVIGAIAVFHKNALLLDLMSFILVCVGGFFVLVMAVASYFFLLDEARFRRFAPISRDLLKNASTSRAELAQVYMTMMAFCLVHAAAFFMISVFSYKLRARNA
ncbi:hypothetical protein Aduo_000418 [Ancylostoma duodenale]